jgi:signal transduction histidine kinase
MIEHYDENKPLYGSRGFAIYLKLLKSKYPHVDIDELLQYAQMEPYQVSDDAHLFSQKQTNLFYEKIVELTGNSNIAREAGRFASTPEAMGTMQGSVIGLLSPARYYELVGILANKISKSAHYTARKLAHNKVEIIVTPYPGTIEQPFQCQNRMGYWEAVSDIFSLKPPKIEHPKCLFKGDDVCHYIVSWKESPAFILRRIRNISTVILGLVCLVVFFRLPASVFAVVLPASISIVLVLNWFARSFEIRDMRRTIEKMRGDSDKLVEQIEINYENSLLVNEIGQVLAKESSIDGLFSEVANILEKRLDYDRCMLLLPNSQKGALEFKAGYGFAEEELETVKNSTYSLDKPHPNGLFTGVFLTQKSALFNNLEETKQKRLSLDTYEMLEKMGIRSIISCPIVYEDESLGVLAVSNVSNKRQLFQRDINLFMGIAAQIASRMHNVELETQLRQNQKMEAIGILAGGVAHDFNNILTTILGYGELAISRLPEDNPVRSMVKDMYHAGERASGLTRQLLAFSRKQVMETKVTNLNTIVTDMGKMLGRLIGEDLHMDIITADNIGNIKADIGQIEQILMNLVVNARDAMPCGGRLTVETGEIYLDEKYVQSHKGVKEGTNVVLTVTDTGEGMSPEVQEEIFEPFFTTKEMGKGTGLGLSTVYGIVKQHQGHIFVYSELGHGTTFKIYLPVVDEPLEKREFGAVTAMPRGTETILVVDDDASIRKLVVDTLEPLGYKVMSAACGEDALTVYRSAGGKVDLLLSDVIMPGMNGRELIEIVLNENPGVKTVLMSGYTDSIISERDTLLKDTVFINKPLLPLSLAGRIRAVLDSGCREDE